MRIAELLSTVVFLIVVFLIVVSWARLRHLDFRSAIDVAPLGGAQRAVTATTLVRTHNRLGRAYLAVIMPFHRLIVPAMFNQAAARPTD